MSTTRNHPDQTTSNLRSLPLPSRTAPAPADTVSPIPPGQFVRQFRDLHSLSSERQALYRWGEQHHWPCFPISAWETICGGSQEAWQVAVEELTPEQLQRAQTAIQALSAQAPLLPSPQKQADPISQKTRSMWPFRRPKLYY